DQEFVGLFGGDEIAAATYVVELFGGISVAYERDVDLRFNLSFIRLWPLGGQPFLTDDLTDFRNHWLDNEDTTGLNFVQLLSGRRDLPFGGVGFISSGCSDGAYAISGYLNGAFVSPTENFSLNNWDQTVVAHEMGHNSGTFHTHDGYTPTIDDCGNGIPSRGTIMSYCHIYTGYMTNIDYRFHRRVQEVVQNEFSAANCVVFDCNGNGIDDSLDIADFGSPDVNANGIPDECEDCNGNDTLDNIDIAGPTSADVNGNGIPDECEADCNGNSIPDEFEIAADPGLDFNGNNIPDVCEADCDGSGTPDFLDIILEPQSDLDRNNVLDICQDCDGNFVSDWIDLERQHNLFVCDRIGLVREYHQRSGWPITQYNSGGPFIPYDATVGPDRALYIANFSGGEILRQTLLVSGAMTPFVPSGGALSQPTALLFGADNNLYVAEQSDGSVQKFDGTTGAHLGAFVSAGSGGLILPFGMTYGISGNLFITSSNNTVLEYDGASGAFVGTFVSAGSGGLSSPTGLAFIPATGNLVVASHATDQLLEYDGATGAFLKIFSDGLSITLPWGLKVGPNGNLFAARGGAVPRIIEYVPEGRYHRYYIRNEADMVSPAGMAFMPQSQFDTDGNGILDVCVGGLPGCCDTPGDANNSGTVNIGDVTFLIARIFAGGAAPPCQDEADENGDGTVNIADVTYLIARIFAAGPAPICGTTGS
ncbi:MAG: hypothetical protein IH914_07595, partial [candidate division Zixibacteria bacterium]|nr:hypothetical protein [candidate division Zixibacteria bacterium]